MKKLFIVANWKSNKLQSEAIEWLERAKERNLSFPENKTIIVCPSYTLLSNVTLFINEHELPLKIGSQDVSSFEAGAYTGAVNGKQLKEFGEYVIIGHSERRRYFQETDEILLKKVIAAKQSGLIPIYCIQGENDAIPEGIEIVAYEPVSAIGTGTPDTPENANAIAASLQKSHPTVQFILYGGSVTPENVSQFTTLPFINGVLVGGASLQSNTFFQLADNA